jgi:hypothetical protein
MGGIPQRMGHAASSYARTYLRWWKMTDVQIWSIAAAALTAAILTVAVALRRRRKRAHPHGHIMVDMTVPRSAAVEAEPVLNEVAKARVSGGSDTDQA